MKGLTPTQTLNGRGLKVLVIHTRWNLEIVNSLTQASVAKLTSLGVLETDIAVREVPGAFELPFAAMRLLPGYDAVIAIGVLIKGDTMHFEYISDSTCQGLMRVGLDAGIPVVLGVLTCLTEEQACLRAGIGGADKLSGHNHGEDWGSAAVEMALLKKSSW
ncbi:6,7-dimethyl-8-ribityllumazine synthase [Chytriomyces cf. hyalinus JEL632]|nr:6,7-dimethyl-8-ribityllumazine synthase [Chytriomyces cf. hyalinus JEL632]